MRHQSYRKLFHTTVLVVSFVSPDNVPRAKPTFTSIGSAFNHEFHAAAAEKSPNRCAATTVPYSFESTAE
jgi:hypothetical protein